MRQPDPLPPDIAQLLRRGAVASEPPIAVRERLRTRLATALASPVTLLRPLAKTGSAGLGALAPSRALVGAFAGFVLGAASMWALRKGPAPLTPAPAVAAPISSARVAAAPNAERQTEASRSGPATSRASEQAAIGPAPVQAPPARTATHRFVRKARISAAPSEMPLPASPTVPATSSNAAAVQTHWGLEAEGELLQKGRTAMVRGDTEGALAAVEEHASRFPHGKLAEEREALKIQVFVAEDRAPEARDALGAFEREYPKSLLGPALEEAVVGRIQ